jgi:glycosyltransferase involved in cell wall biosynthesis
MRVLHISADYPDPLAPTKTRAIEALLELVPEHDHQVWSLNRVGFRRGLSAIAFGEGHYALTYGAPPYGIRFTAGVQRVAEFILDSVARTGDRPDAIHAHKLSVEGLIGQTVARQLDRPLIVSSQGNSDLKIIRARPDLRRRWRSVWTEAAIVLPFAPWTLRGLEILLGERAGPAFLLPCPVADDTMLPPATTSTPVIRTAFHLNAYRNKNAAGLMLAVGKAQSRFPDLRLEVVGGGDPEGFAALTDLASAIDPERIRIVGPQSRDRIPLLFNASVCMALVSHRESFGMVFAEALLAGCPILGPSGRAIDGYLPDACVGLFVPPGDVPAIAEALMRLVAEEALFKKRLAALQQNGGLAIFRRDSIAGTYRRALALVARGGHSAIDGDAS